MGLFYCIIAAILGFFFTKMYTAPNMKVKVLVLILLPIILNLCISLLVALFVDSSLGYGYDAGNIGGILFPATLVMMIVLGFSIDLKKDMMENQQANNDGMEVQKMMIENRNMPSNSPHSVKWPMKLIAIALLIIAFLFALNGRYSFPVEGYVFDKWSGESHYIDDLLD